MAKNFIKTSADRLIEDLGGVNAVVKLLAESPYNRSADDAIQANTIRAVWMKQGIQPTPMLRIALAYQARYGESLDLSRYHFKNGESKRIRPRPALEYRNGRRVLRDDLVNPMAGFMR